MKRQIVEIGKQYKDWLVLEKIGIIKKNVYYKCKCLRCGNEYDVRKPHILNKNQSFCCKRCGKRKEIMPNDTYKQLKVIKEIDGKLYKGKNQRQFLCECLNCNNIFTISIVGLLSTTQSFTCNRCARRKDITGQKFNMLTVIELDRIENNKSYYKCICDCGKIVTARSDHIQDSRNVSCGCYKREIHTGENNHNWKGGVLTKYKKMRARINHIYKAKIHKRDDYTCHKCKKKFDKLICHHILDFATYEHMRDIESNMCSLCNKCHYEYHKLYGGYSATTYLPDFEEWLGEKYKYRAQLLSDYCEPIYI
ncbi:MAG: hypothetical protein KDH96_00925 [Candidatus Riesia sp.]|nr:hypothetical protein [Candidatus Riesia sp.]